MEWGAFRGRQQDVGNRKRKRLPVFSLQLSDELALGLVGIQIEVQLRRTPRLQ